MSKLKNILRNRLDKLRYRVNILTCDDFLILRPMYSYGACCLKCHAVDEVYPFSPQEIHYPGKRNLAFKLCFCFADCLRKQKKYTLTRDTWATILRGARKHQQKLKRQWQGV